MRKEIINTIYESISKYAGKGIGQLYTEDQFYDKTNITFSGKSHVNFGSYSYLGFQHDQRLKEAAIDAIERFGIQYPSSRSYVSSTPYRELEYLLGEIFQHPVILATTTTLAHVAVMPIVVKEGDVIIMDQQVHSSVQFMISHLQLQGIPFHLVRHNHLENLEKQIQSLSEKHNRIWYMVDGVYSMYGDTAPIKELHILLKKYKKFNLYIDDAHGMSWCGSKGSGFALDQSPFHERMVLVTSLNKAFASGGAVVVIPDPELSNIARTCGGPFIFAGQLQMSALGAGIACAKIHLSDEIYELQANLKSKIGFCEALLRKHNLPFIERAFATPIFFIGVGLPRLGYTLVKKMIRSGHFLNLAIFPAVSTSCTGIRFTITRNHSFTQIETMVEALAINFQETLYEEERSIRGIYKAFRKSPIYIGESKEEPPTIVRKVKKFRLQHETSIEQIPATFWNKLMDGKGTYNWRAILSMEKIFQDNPEAHNNWDFHYFILRNKAGKVILATYFTCCILKDDAIAPAKVSQKVEAKRIEDPYYLCSKTMFMGCPLSIGDHLYIDKSNEDWKEALVFFLEEMAIQQDKLNANVLNFRDLDTSQQEIRFLFEGQGFIKVDLLDNHIINGLPVQPSMPLFLETLRSDRRRFVRQRAIAKSESFTVNLLNAENLDQLDAIYQLYLNVKKKSFELNIFDCPKSLFRSALLSPDWEVMTLSLSAEGTNGAPIALALNYKNGDQYHFLFAGLDYCYVKTHDSYNQLLWQLVLRASKLKCTKLNLGLTTAQNKRKFGAQSILQGSYVRVKDDYNLKIINSMTNN